MNNGVDVNIHLIDMINAKCMPMLYFSSFYRGFHSVIKNSLQQRLAT